MQKEFNNLFNSLSSLAKRLYKRKTTPVRNNSCFRRKGKKAKEEKPSVIIYARVSSSENKKNLESQCNRLRDYASARGYQIAKEVKEIGSGLMIREQN
ncbi:recombinase family protein [Candidatus Uabimicrobium helgolandensis]